MNKHVIIAGASGMVGSIILKHALSSDDVASVASLVRKSSGKQHPKLKEVIHKDFSDLNAVIAEFQNKDIAFFCIGVYTGTLPDNEFKEITVDQATVFGNALKDNSPNARLCFLSGQGADQKEKSKMAFARYKGMAENYLISLGLGDLLIFRPAYIYPVEKRTEPNMMYRISRKIYPLMKYLMPGSVITSEQLGEAMICAGMNGGKLILENKDIKALIT